MYPRFSTYCDVLCLDGNPVIRFHPEANISKVACYRPGYKIQTIMITVRDVFECLSGNIHRLNVKESSVYNVLDSHTFALDGDILTFDGMAVGHIYESAWPSLIGKFSDALKNLIEYIPFEDNEDADG